METIALLDAAILLYLKEYRDGTGPDMTAYLEHCGLRTTANSLALALRLNLQARGLVKLIGSHRRFREGAAANLCNSSLSPLSSTVSAVGGTDNSLISLDFLRAMEPVSRFQWTT